MANKSFNNNGEQASLAIIRVIWKYSTAVDSSKILFKASPTNAY